MKEVDLGSLPGIVVSIEKYERQAEMVYKKV